MAGVKTSGKLKEGCIGTRARNAGVKPKYMAMAYWNPHKRRGGKK